MTFKSDDGYVDAFYKIAAEFGFDYAQPISPKEFFETQLLPAIHRLKASEERAVNACIATEAWWLEEGARYVEKAVGFPGAPYCIFAVRNAAKGKNADFG